MITVIDNKKTKSYNCTKTKAAKIIGVTYNTVLRWSKKTLKETYNHFDLYFDTENIPYKE
jgi:transposase